MQPIGYGIYFILYFLLSFRYFTLHFRTRKSIECCLCDYCYVALLFQQIPMFILFIRISNCVNYYHLYFIPQYHGDWEPS
jgi:hypothetical protein